MSPFFLGRCPADPGLAVFLTAGCEPPDRMRRLVAALDDAGVDCLELAVPFPGSVTDGPVLRRAADRAIALGTGLDETLDFVERVRPGLRHTRIAVLADWRHSMAGLGEAAFARRLAAAGADAALAHGVPPRRRAAWHEGAAEAGLPLVTTCYAASPDETRAAAARDAGAYLYLVAHYGRTGTTPATGHAALAATVTGLRRDTRAPIAIGFGVRAAADVRRVAEAGADAAIVGTEVASVLDRANAAGTDAVAAVADYVLSLVGSGGSEHESTRGPERAGVPR
ncbi:tryptophan synthase subunit alpha [Actinokineospora sp.]|uniref:tryptophan synthase subunit alpha n=1 Tax=Actinokineospora sp. TaxID=1872133 RepID=UPI00403774CB